MTTAASLIPDTDQIEIFVEGIFRHASPRGYVSLRSFFDNGSNKVFRIMPVQMESGLRQVMAVAGSFAKLAAECREPVVACPPCAVFNNPKTAREDIAEGLELAVECDSNPSRGVMALEQIIGPATFVVASGGKWTDPATGEVEDKLHGHWRLAKPARGEEQIAKLKQARDLATAIIGGDPSNKPICHPIRWPGSWHRKGDPVLCRIVEQRPDNEIGLDTALEALKAFAPASKKGNGADNATPQEPGGNDWAEKVRGVLSGENYHEGLVVLAAKLVSAGVTAAAAEGILRGVMESVAGPRDDRWLSRYNDIPRAVRTAMDKYAKPNPSEGLGEWDAGEADDSAIPPRGWLLGNAFCRGFVSSLLADGGVGKTATRYAQFLALATGCNLTGEHVFQRSRVLVISLEDDDKELRRRIRAARLHYGIDQADLKGWLFLAAPGLRAGKLLTIGKDGHLITAGLAARIEKVIVERKIDLVSLDPFVKAHAVGENDNNAIDAVIQILTELASKHDIGVDVPHHTSKGTPDPGNASRGRGASAMKDGARLVYTLAPMTPEEARCFDLDEATRRLLVRMDSGKVNIAPPMTEAKWFRLIGVSIGNGTELYPAGDTVQTVEPWIPPNKFEGLGQHVLNQMLTDIEAGFEDGNRYTDGQNAGERAAWRVVTKHAPNKTEAQAKAIIKAWVRSGLLFPRNYENPKSRKQVRGLWVEDSKRPGTPL